MSFAVAALLKNIKGRSYVIYYNGGIQTDSGSFRRSVCTD